MSEDLVTIEVNGSPLEARKGAMLIEVTDAAGIWIPRFCYHKKLSVAANCRMCLVEVEKAPKPLPACATPVMDGMKVYTRSPKAIAAQQATMEFLLINHPLDCPICDQGGECELQDIAMGYGDDVSRFVERKRVVKDKDIGPLIKTAMTRCIHCTRCVRFGEEIAGLKELGATGRGEDMEIGTYVAKSITSELSGNVIDLCPVGALTAKPSHYTGRSWEYVQHPGIAPHDAIGSNISLHVIRNEVKRVVPRENEAINETWISDRDRFSYEGLYSSDRASQPWINGKTVEWQAALEAVREGLNAAVRQYGPESVGFLASPNATLEEMFLVQKLARSLGIPNIDHRLRQGDMSDQDSAPVYPWLGMPLTQMERLGAVLLVGSNIPMEQPLAGHRLRKAALAGGKVMCINPRDYGFRFPLAVKTIVDPLGMISALAAVAQAVADANNDQLPGNLQALAPAKPDENARAMAEYLINTENTALFMGNLATAHPALSQLRALANNIAGNSGSALGYLPEAANSVGGWLAGVLPHRLAGGRPAETPGLDARALWESPRRAYFLLGIEPEFDCWNPAAAREALDGADFVVSLATHLGDQTKACADVILPIAAFAETSGSYVNAEGVCQSFQQTVQPPGEARPAWKVLRVLGNVFDLPGFDYMNSREIADQVLSDCAHLAPDNLAPLPQTRFSGHSGAGLVRASEVPIYAVDSLVRRAQSLQRTPLARPAEIRLNPELAREVGLMDASRARIRQSGNEVSLPLVLDEGIPKGCVWVPAGLPETDRLGPMFGRVDLGPA
jgi:NADH-quinone oxidoreductase subunit G